MKKVTANISASVRARLKNAALNTNLPYMEVLKYYAMERFLYRLGNSKYADKFILKGALMFSVWRVAERRTTLDIDFLAQFDNKIQAIEQAVMEICGIHIIDDGLVLDPATVAGEKIKVDAKYEGVRIKFTAFIERTRIPVQIDFGFGDIIYPEPDDIDYPVFLDFPAPKLKGYPPETVIAEKFEAMIKLGALNSRMKDFYDVWLLIQKHKFKESVLAEADKITFEHRKTHLPEGSKFFAEEIYDTGSDRQKLWKSFLNKGGIKTAPDMLADAAKKIEKFLFGPVGLIRKQSKADR
jgi:predicted nucleotidyltransferase component of viral defense system